VGLIYYGLTPPYEAWSVLAHLGSKLGRFSDSWLMDQRCPHCEEPLIEIDHYGELLIGCVECNRWMGKGKILMQLDEADITALRGRVRPN
jgi:hypothetical protein